VFYSIPHLPWCTPPFQLFDSPNISKITTLCNTFLCTNDLLPSFDTLHSPFTLGDLKNPLINSISSHSPQHLLLASIPATFHLHTPPSMPRERGKSKRGACYYNTLSHHNRITHSQQALISHFSIPWHTLQRMQDAPQSTPL